MSEIKVGATVRVNARHNLHQVDNNTGVVKEIHAPVTGEKEFVSKGGYVPSDCTHLIQFEKSGWCWYPLDKLQMVTPAPADAIASLTASLADRDAEIARLREWIDSTMWYARTFVPSQETAQNIAAMLSDALEGKQP